MNLTRCSSFFGEKVLKSLLKIFSIHFQPLKKSSSSHFLVWVHSTLWVCHKAPRSTSSHFRIGRRKKQTWEKRKSQTNHMKFMNATPHICRESEEKIHHDDNAVSIRFVFVWWNAVEPPKNEWKQKENDWNYRDLEPSMFAVACCWRWSTGIELRSLTLSIEFSLFMAGLNDR